MRAEHNASRERPTQERILAVLRASGGASPAVVAESLGMNPATARSQLRYLAARGAVAKVDGRYMVAVTATAQATRADDAELQTLPSTDATAKPATAEVVKATAIAAAFTPAPLSPASATGSLTQPPTAGLSNPMSPPAAAQALCRKYMPAELVDVLAKAGLSLDISQQHFLARCSALGVTPAGLHAAIARSLPGTRAYLILAACIGARERALESHAACSQGNGASHPVAPTVARARV